MPLKEDVSAESIARRRSLRIVMRIPLYVSPADSAYSEEWEPVETLVISLHGGMIRSRRKFPVGTMLDIRKRDTQRFTRGRVVWSGTGAREYVFEVGFEILEPPGFWEVNFPKDRWTGNERSTSSKAS